jgi:hypothetical protein
VRQLIRELNGGSWRLAIRIPGQVKTMAWTGHFAVGDKAGKRKR